MSINPNRILAKKLRSYRITQGLSQETFAERCGLHRTYIGAIERGERNITLDTLNEIAIALGVSSAELISTSEKAFGQTLKTDVRANRRRNK